MAKIVTMNVRGLREHKKHKEFFLYCKNLDYQIVLLHETHSDVESEAI